MIYERVVRMIPERKEIVRIVRYLPKEKLVRLLRYAEDLEDELTPADIEAIGARQSADCPRRKHLA